MTCITPLEAFLIAVLMLVVGLVAGFVLAATLSAYVKSPSGKRKP